MGPWRIDKILSRNGWHVVSERIPLMRHTPTSFNCAAAEYMSTGFNGIALFASICSVLLDKAFVEGKHSKLIGR
jgi:hypothetical protein